MLQFIKRIFLIEFIFVLFGFVPSILMAQVSHSPSICRTLITELPRVTNMYSLVSRDAFNGVQSESKNGHKGHFTIVELEDGSRIVFPMRSPASDGDHLNDQQMFGPNTWVGNNFFVVNVKGRAHDLSGGWQQVQIENFLKLDDSLLRVLPFGQKNVSVKDSVSFDSKLEEQDPHLVGTTTHRIEAMGSNFEFWIRSRRVPRVQDSHPIHLGMPFLFDTWDAMGFLKHFSESRDARDLRWESATFLFKVARTDKIDVHVVSEGIVDLNIDSPQYPTAFKIRLNLDKVGRFSSLEVIRRFHELRLNESSLSSSSFSVKPSSQDANNAAAIINDRISQSADLSLITFAKNSPEFEIILRALLGPEIKIDGGLQPNIFQAFKSAAEEGRLPRASEIFIYSKPN